MQRVGRAQALHHAHRHREERQVSRDQRLGDQPGDAHRGQHDDDHRGQGEDWDRLRGDDPRHQAAVECGDMDDADGDQNAERRSEGEAQQRRRQRHPGMVDEASRRGRLPQDRVFEEVDRNLVRRRQRRLGLRHRLDDELPRRRRLARPAVEVALERRVHGISADIPRSDNAEQDRRDRPDLVAQPVSHRPDPLRQMLAGVEL